MLIKNKIVSQLMLLTVFTITLIACGGGGSSTPPPPAKDTTPPVVVSTIPTSEEFEVVTSSYVSVVFNEAIANVTTNQVTIHPYANGVIDSANQIKLNNIDSFHFDANTKTLEVRLKVGDLVNNTQYRVSVQKIKDTSGNVMVGSCQWDFTTIGAAAITTGKTGVCSTDSDLVPGLAPGDPQNVNAIAGDSSVTISWQAPGTGGVVDYYKIEKSIDNAQTFSVVDNNIDANVLSYTDPNAVNDISHIYRVYSGNGIDISNGVNSNAITPTVIKVVVVPGAPQNVKAVAGNGTVTVSWSAPVTGDTVEFYNVDKSVNGSGLQSVQSKIPASSLQVVDNKAQNGASHVYRVIAGNAVGLSAAVNTNNVTPKAESIPIAARVELISQSPMNFNNFGEDMVFSSDGNTIVVGEYGGDLTNIADVGTVQIYNKINGLWVRAQVLAAQKPAKGIGFGYSVALTQDGTLLAIGGLSANSVDLYIKSGNQWVFSQTLQTTDPNARAFGTTIAFHPNSTLLAIGDYVAFTNGITQAGAVHLFTKKGTSWVFSQLLTAQLPKAFNQFGAIFKFSPDGRTLAVSEMKGDTSTVTDAGTVQLFNNNGASWLPSQVLVSKNPGTNFNFGSTGLLSSCISFSPDSKTLAIGEPGGQTVQLFAKSNLKWNPGQVLTSPGAGRDFGVAVAYSSGGLTLAVGDSSGISNGTSHGKVYLFNKSAGKWVNSRALIAPVSSINNTIGQGFGTVLGFNQVSNELAIYEINSNQTSTQDGVVWIIDLSQLP